MHTHWVSQFDRRQFGQANMFANTFLVEAGRFKAKDEMSLCLSNVSELTLLLGTCLQHVRCVQLTNFMVIMLTQPVSIDFSRYPIDASLKMLNKIHPKAFNYNFHRKLPFMRFRKLFISSSGLMQHHEEIVDYFNNRGVSAIFLFRRNLLRRMISILANSYDRENKPLNGTHKSHVHSPHEAKILAKYKPPINATLLVPTLKQVADTTAKALKYFNSTRHIILYYEDVVKNSTKLVDVLDFLKVPQMKLKSRQVKIHKGSLSSHVDNWKEVQKALKGTPYESFLHEDYRK
ncbi:hypothetical protein ACFE04_024033 [Oxalis oulophora]